MLTIAGGIVLGFLLVYVVIPMLICLLVVVLGGGVAKERPRTR